MADFSKFKVGDNTYLVKDAEARAVLPTKLTMVTSLPLAPADGQVVLYTGATTVDLVQGGMYMYDETDAEWKLISSANVESIPTATVESYFI